MDDDREKRRINSKDIAELSATFTYKRMKVIGDIINISEIGMGVFVKESFAEDLNIGDLIQGTITTNRIEEDSIEFDGMIVRIERPKRSKEPKIVLGIRFVSEISLPDRVSGLIISLDDDWFFFNESNVNISVKYFRLGDYKKKEKSVNFGRKMAFFWGPNGAIFRSSKANTKPAGIFWKINMDEIME